MEQAEPLTTQYPPTSQGRAILSVSLTRQRRQLLLFIVSLVLLVTAWMLIAPSTPVLIYFFLAMFCGLLVWSGVLLRDTLHPEQFIYQKIITQCSHYTSKVSDPEILLDKMTHLLYTTLETETFTLWRYDGDENSFCMLRTSGAALSSKLAELPVDIPADTLRKTVAVSNLASSALKQGLVAANIKFFTTLNLGETVIGAIGFGPSALVSNFTARHREWLRVLAGSLTPLLHSSMLSLKLAQTAENLHLAYRRTIDVQDNERRSLATELHDDILGRLTTMALTLNKSQKEVRTRPVEVQNWLGTLEGETQSVNRRLREITQGLHPTVLTDLGLISATRAYMDTLAKQPRRHHTRQTVTLTAQGFEQQRIDNKSIERDIYYITKQALDNALNHAQADQIFIHMRWDDDAISVTVRDTGRGMPAAPEKLVGFDGHLGLLSMHERTVAWRGSLSLHTDPDQGTTVRARLPVDQASPYPADLQAYVQYLT
jgi:signal transduction histidine kinase